MHSRHTLTPDTLTRRARGIKGTFSAHRMAEQRNWLLGVVLIVYTLVAMVIVSTFLSDREYIPVEAGRMRVDGLPPSMSPSIASPGEKRTSNPALPTKRNYARSNLITAKVPLLRIDPSRSNQTHAPLHSVKIDHSRQNHTSAPFRLVQMDHSRKNHTSTPLPAITVDPSRRKELAGNKEWKQLQEFPREKLPWVYNKTAADVFRKELQECCGEDFIVTKKNHPVNTTIQYDAESKSRLNVSEAIARRFPDENPMKKTYAQCSMVGSSGILSGSGCGQTIDSADFVIRCNLAPVAGQYKADVGMRTHLITMNPSMVRNRYQNFRNKTMKEWFVRDLSEYGNTHVWMTPFSYKFGTGPSYKVQDVMKELKVKQEMVFANPNFTGPANIFWKRKGVRSFRASTGLFLVTAALRICERVHLYGFWPWHFDRLGRNLTHHYFDNPKTGWAHNFPHEFRQYQRLHNMGVLHLNTGSCT
ncbi:ST8SIA1 [Branchiostoma lanceolatum]|uniref:ST8SIA1 protein n=2 Tax=Branchiostoma lanceolatum TaxID=7740 RepID=A0A8K0EX19_BRALA|nr:ST8SIA1 [Branchiostoma lanceolatum]